MAIYHCSVKVIGRSNGRSATGAAAYRSGEKITDERTGIVHDYTRKSGIDYTNILAPNNAPSWVHDRSSLWNQVEHSENRKDSQLCREVEVALPIELSSDENQRLVQRFIRDEFVRKGMVADVAIHHAQGENPHAHILLTTRHLETDGFGPKNRDWNKKDLLETWRKSWETHANRALENAGHKQKIDHRTLEAQGIERIPQIHVGPKVFEMEARGIKTERGAKAVEIDAANQTIISLQEYKEALEHERNLEIEKRQNERGTSRADRTTGQSPSNTERSSHSAATSPTAGQQDPLRHMGSLAAHNGPGVDSGGPGFEEFSAPAERCDQSSKTSHQTPTDQISAHRVHGSNATHATAVDRILALVPATDRNGEGRQHMDANSPEQLDRTYLAVRRQLTALNCDSYEIGIKNSDGKMMTRHWSKTETLKSVNWLKRENAKGADIYVRPAGDKNQGIILLDDLNQKQINEMKAKGYEPAVVVETSPQNHQAWVRLSQQPIEPELATGISKAMAGHFDADPNSADWRHFGRLAGFTNQKPEHRTAQGRSPWVLCHTSTGQQASRGDETVQTISKRIEEHRAATSSETCPKQAVNAPQGPSKQDPIQTYQRHLKTVRERFGADMDLSRADYMICSNMALQGFLKDQLVQALEQASPDLGIRKASHQNDYCQRTADAAFANPKVQEHLNSSHNNIKSKSQEFSR
mgnify:CR=1 FL=1